MKIHLHFSLLRFPVPCLALAISSVISLQAAEPEIIDCHVHLWTLARPDGVSWIKKDDPVLYRDFLPNDHEPLAKAAGVTGVVIVQAGQSLPDNQWNLDTTGDNKKFYRGVVGNLSLVIGTDEFEPLLTQLCKDPRYLGYRLSGRYQEKLSDAFYQHLELTAEKGKSVDILVGQYSLKDVDAIARKVPKLRIILDHFGNLRLSDKPLDPQWVKDVRAVAKNPNVFCKVSALYGRVDQQPAPKDIAFYRPILDLAYECFGEDRLIFGSDWPVSRTTGDYASVLTLTRAYFDGKGPAVCEKLFHANAIRFYAVPPTD
jgi:L-fuconolactonase